MQQSERDIQINDIYNENEVNNVNNNHLQQIFNNYIERFEVLNNPNDPKHQEYYKWQVAYKFHDAMDKALAAPGDAVAKYLGD